MESSDLKKIYELLLLDDSNVTGDVLEETLERVVKEKRHDLQALPNNFNCIKISKDILKRFTPIKMYYKQMKNHGTYSYNKEQDPTQNPGKIYVEFLEYMVKDFSKSDEAKNRVPI